MLAYYAVLCKMRYVASTTQQASTGQRCTRICFRANDTPHSSSRNIHLKLQTCPPIYIVHQYYTTQSHIYSRHYALYIMGVRAPICDVARFVLYVLVPTRHVSRRLTADWH